MYLKFNNKKNPYPPGGEATTPSMKRPGPGPPNPQRPVTQAQAPLLGFKFLPQILTNSAREERQWKRHHLLARGIKASPHSASTKPLFELRNASRNVRPGGEGDLL
ncbi:hypothetical protein JTE90_018563 [Oedothorax gibbosus]|uniref:Uncharacterized protein n=1 Tax=Oedothorax gibbosus TaxID=931172 RepID=A0AAV6U5D3_9ARAC|nr:hypothetical protein JTE90_018563 [Oedothorax gibbosus]